MISRKDNLLRRPWQQRNFEYHRKKVQSALPAIDTSPPPYRSHVVTKLKKQQKEHERCKKIEHDNFLLLDKMNHIMKTSRVDNVWKNPQPNFLNRIAIYNTIIPKIEEIELDLVDISDDEGFIPSRKSRCIACSLQNSDNIKVPDEAVSWESSKSAGRFRTKSVSITKSKLLPVTSSKLPIMKLEHVTSPKPASSKSRDNTKKQISKEMKTMEVLEPQSILLTRGCLKLSLNFPSDALVKYREKNSETFLMRGICYCKNSPLEAI